MSRVPENVDRDELYVVARRTLLDALVALAEQRDAIVLVGAQAVYLRTAEADLAVSVFTSDGDLGLDPALLGEEPRLEQVMDEAGFVRAADPGIWLRATVVSGQPVNIGVDLLVPDTLGGGGSRAARIPPHARNTARKVAGLEPTTVDNELMTVASLELDRDARVVEVKVAGVAALLVAKAYKIFDRLAEQKPGREADKDAGDVLRLMTASDPAAVAERFVTLLEHPVVGEVTAEGLRRLRSQFGRGRAPGTEMAVGALGGVAVPEEQIRAFAPAFLEQLPQL